MRPIFGLFWTQFSPSHTLWDGHKEMKHGGKQRQIVNMNTHYEAINIFIGLCFEIWANDRFPFLKMQGGPRRIGQIFILRSDGLENGVKMTAMARFTYNLWSNMYPNWLTLRDISKKPIFWLTPSPLALT